jgi:hypothetical protein
MEGPYLMKKEKTSLGTAVSLDQICSSVWGERAENWEDRALQVSVGMPQTLDFTGNFHKRAGDRSRGWELERGWGITKI